MLDSNSKMPPEERKSELINSAKIEHQYLYGLDGLRAFAEISVLFVHVASVLTQYGGEKYYFPLERVTLGAWSGVSLFFTLSGFLITWLLLKEKKRGTIDARNFYVRRMLRIFPVYYLIATFCLTVFGEEFSDLLPREIALIFIMLPNLVNPQAMGMLGHFWSIGAEEQFYITYPVLLKRFGVIPIALTVIIARQSLALVTTGRVEAFILWNGFDLMAVGAIAGWIYSTRHALLSYIHNLRFIFTILFIGLIVFERPARVPWNDLLESIIYAGLMLNVVTKESFLDSRILKFLGKISYGIYMYHLPIIYLLCSLNLRGWKIYTAAFVITTLVAWISFNFIERPFLQLKDRFRGDAKAIS